MKALKIRSVLLAAGVLGVGWSGASWGDSSCGPNSPHYLDPKHLCSSVALIKPMSGGVGCLNGPEAKYTSGAPADTACLRDDLAVAACNVPPPPMGTPSAVYTKDSGPNGLDQCVTERPNGNRTVAKPTCPENAAKSYTRNYIFMYKSGQRQTDIRPGKETLAAKNPVAMSGRDPCQYAAPTTENVVVMCPSSSTPCPPERVDIKSFGQGR